MYWLRQNTGTWDPFAELRTMQREMNRIFASRAPDAGAFPALNVWSNGEEAVVTAELPGVDPGKIDINVVRDHVTIEGAREGEELAEGTVCHRAERGVGRFARTVRLPFEVENDKVQASYRRGVLTVTLPRAEATKPRRIEIAGA